MSHTQIFLLILALLQGALLAWVGVALARSHAYSAGQRVAQFGIALCVPLLGAVLVLSLARAAVADFPPPTRSFSASDE